MSNDNNNIIGIPFLQHTKAEKHLIQLGGRKVLPIRKRLGNTKTRCSCAEQWCEHRSADLGSKKGTLDRNVRILMVHQRWKPDRPDYDRTLFYFDGVPVWETIGTQTTLPDHTINQLMRGR